MVASPLGRVLLIAGAACSAAAQTPAWHQEAYPLDQVSHEIVLDSARERVLRLETPVAASPRLWERIGGAWSLRSTLNAPPFLQTSHFHSALTAYDPVRRRLVVLGAVRRVPLTMTYVYATWEYDGADWRQGPTLPATSAESMAFDPVNQRIVVDSGWSWDGALWRPMPQLAAGNWQLATDPLRARVVAWDSTSGAIAEWDGVAWLPMTPVHTPPPLARCGFCWDPDRSTVLAFGGRTYTPNHIGMPTSEFWEWNGIDWAPIATSGAPAMDASMAFDPVSHRLVAVGHTFDPAMPATSTAIWDGSQWNVQLEQRRWSAAELDPSRGSLAAVGVTAMIDRIGDHETTSALPAALISDSATLTYDHARGRLVLTSQQNGVGPRTWERIGATWSQGVAAPLLLFTTWDAVRGAVVGLGDGLFEWTGSAWNQFAPAPPTGPYAPVAFAHDLAHDELVAVLGYDAAGALQTATWNGTAWTLHVPPVSPPVRNLLFSGSYPYYGMSPLNLATDYRTGGVVLFGGNPPQTPFNPWGSGPLFADMWDWTGTTWVQRATPEAPRMGSPAALLGDPVGHRLVLVTPPTNAWVYDDAGATGTTALGPGCGGGTATPRLGASVPFPGAPAFALDLLDGWPSAPGLFALALRPASAAIGQCTSYVPRPDLLVFATTNASGCASITVPIGTAFAGLGFSAQAALLDPTAPMGFALSGGLRLTIGHP